MCLCTHHKHMYKLQLYANHLSFQINIKAVYRRLQKGWAGLKEPLMATPLGVDLWVELCYPYATVAMPSSPKTATKVIFHSSLVVEEEHWAEICCSPCIFLTAQGDYFFMKLHKYFTGTWKQNIRPWMHVLTSAFYQESVPNVKWIILQHPICAI